MVTRESFIFICLHVIIWLTLSKLYLLMISNGVGLIALTYANALSLFSQFCFLRWWSNGWFVFHCSTLCRVSHSVLLYSTNHLSADGSAGWTGQWWGGQTAHRSHSLQLSPPTPNRDVITHWHISIQSFIRLSSYSLFSSNQSTPLDLKCMQLIKSNYWWGCTSFSHTRGAIYESFPHVMCQSFITEQL